MIYGIGHDVLEMGRIQGLMEGSHGIRFVERILTASECELAAGKGGKRTEFVAGRFAAKEAISKAFGCGIGSMVGFRDIEILPDKLGRPVAVLSDAAWSRMGLGEPKHFKIHLTISHQTELASAFAVIEQLDRKA